MLVLIVGWSSRGSMFDTPIAALSVLTVLASGTAFAVSFAHRRPGIWLPASIVAAPTLSIPIATALDSTDARVIALATPPLAVLGAAWWLRRLSDTAVRWPSVALTAATLMMISTDLLARNPYRELLCTPICPVNDWAGRHRPDLLDKVEMIVLATAVISIAAAVISVTRHAPTLSRAVAASGAAIVMAVGAIDLVGREGRTPDNPAAMWAIGLQLAAISASVAACLVQPVRQQVGRRRVLRWTSAVERSASGTSVLDVLRHASDDPTVRLIDEPTGTAGRATTRLAHSGRTVAVVEHRQESAERLRAAVSAPLVAMMENDLLLATAQRELDEVRRARRAVVDRSDLRLRQLQRDLHDGAQQRLIALGMQLSTAASVSPEPERTQLLDAADHAAEALTGLRRVSHRSVPPLLDDAGLHEALLSLAEERSIGVDLDIGALAHLRFAPDVEWAAYRFVAASVDEACAAGADSVRVRVDATPGLDVTTCHAAVTAPSRVEDGDRVQAAGGNLSSAVAGGVAVHQVHFS